MKKLPLAVAVAIALLASSAHAQNLDAYGRPIPEPEDAQALAPPEEVETSIRTFLEQKNRVVVEHLHPVPTVPLAEGASLRLAAAWGFEPGAEAKRVLGVRVDLEGTSLAGEERTAYLNLHEVEEAIRAITFMEGAAREKTSGVAKAHYVSLEGFGVGAAVSSEGIRYFVIGGREAPAEAALSAESFAALRERLAAARDRLFQP